MYIEQGIQKKNSFWGYMLGSLILIIVSFIGQLLFVGALFIDSQSNNLPFPTSEKGMMHYFDSNTTLFFLLIPFAIVLAALYLLVRFYHNQSFLSVTTSRKKVDWKRVALSFTVWASITIVTTLISYFLYPEDFKWNFNPLPFAFLVIIGALLIPIQTSTEEYIFRGYLMQGFATLSKNKWFPLLLTSIIFGGMHWFNPEVTQMGPIIMVYYIGTGLFLGIITLMDEGMELALGFHAANNLIGALLVTSDWSAFQTNSIFKDVSDPSAGFDVILPILIIYPILLFVFGKKYQWTNWKEKLTGKILND
ncbi:CPBP family intramembrane glutamic endopeptidase [Flavobacterium turcicum]|uniref:CPBP family intramembrane metalloprotease n=1 Tax=Flavobacterium turcicum TaxID=2764718 RepID=A0ABR7JDP4_9FLAO|nr:CPBP family intramembrane glutamic endopeptidase [Flavobacterium turcicum]MBC5862622.1 CPBP family intramembrane metalloprotease [Flavobacterium turcicum]NHL01354.1 CPBP family intramembrane metalloprotease [Flavobacterium turcicum]